MKFKTSESGTPYIELGTGRLIFSRSTAHPVKGYKYICYSGADTTTVCVSSARAKKKRFAKIVEDIHFTLRVIDFRRNDKKSFPIKVKVLSKISLNFIKNLIVSNVVGEHLPYEKISFIEKQINMEDETDGWDDDPDLDDEEYEDDTPVTKKKMKKSNGKKKQPLKIKRTLSFTKVKPLKG